jgi:RNA polymerase sigma factor (sigma-70 family)
MSDEELLYLIRCGNEWAFEELYRKCEKMIWKIARGIIAVPDDVVDVENIVGECKYNFIPIIDKYREDLNANFKTYFMICIKHRIYSLLKKQWEYVENYPISFEEQVNDNKVVFDYLKDPNALVPDKIMVVKEASTHYEVLTDKKLTQRERTIYHYLLLGYKTKDIAEILNISLKSCYNASYRISLKKDIVNKELTKQMKYDKLK